MNSNLITCAPGQCKKNQNTFEVFISRRREVLKVHALIDYGKSIVTILNQPFMILMKCIRKYFFIKNNFNRHVFSN